MKSHIKRSFPKLFGLDIDFKVFGATFLGLDGNTSFEVIFSIFS